MPGATKNLNLADGQVSTVALTEILAGPATIGQRIMAVFANVGGLTETLVISLSRAGGTARRIIRVVLLANEQLVINGLAINGDDSLKASTSNATSVDYTISYASDNAPFAIVAIDANGAIKSGAAALGSGDLAASGNLTATGGTITGGASGTAGVLDLFAGTASKGKLELTCSDQAGDTKVSVNAAQMAAARTLTIPDPLASADFLMGKQAAVARTATSDGLTTGTIADAGVDQFVEVTSASANNIITLPTPTPGTRVWLDVGANGFKLQTSTPASISINGGSGAGAKSTIGANLTVLAICISATKWKAFSMASDGTLAAVAAAA